MCPCVMSSFLSLFAMPISLPDWRLRLHLKTRHGHLLRHTHHPHMPTRPPCLSPVLSALQMPRTSTLNFESLNTSKCASASVEASWSITIIWGS
jgi:hypothetical protein